MRVQEISILLWMNVNVTVFVLFFSDADKGLNLAE